MPAFSTHLPDTFCMSGALLGTRTALHSRYLPSDPQTPAVCERASRVQEEMCGQGEGSADPAENGEGN